MLSELELLSLEALHPNVVYRTLRQMEGLEWIQSEWDTENNQGPPRRLYRLTRIGEAALMIWQEELVNAQDSIRRILKQKSTE